MTDLFEEPSDATPLQPDEREGLLQSWITHRRDLNEAERENIARALAWARRRRRRRPEDLLSEAFAACRRPLALERVEELRRAFSAGRGLDFELVRRLTDD